MGSGSHDLSSLRSSVSAAAHDPVSYFAHTTAVRSGTATAGVHESMDMTKPNKEGKIIRESRCSDEHPDAVPVAILFDVTGSMRDTPPVFVQKLPDLIGLMVEKGFIKDPQLLFGAIGDASKGDRAPLQVGQFESDNRSAEVLGNVYLEGGGGGGSPPMESYELAMFAMARYTSADAWEKNGRKGYLFLVGDERPYPAVSVAQIKRYIDPNYGGQEDVPLDTIIGELREKFEFFWIVPRETYHGKDPEVVDYLQALLGENLVFLDKAENISELIAMTIGLFEGNDAHAVVRDMAAAGASSTAIVAAQTALSTVTGRLVRTGTVTEGNLE